MRWPENSVTRKNVFQPLWDPQCQMLPWIISGWKYVPGNSVGARLKASC